MIDEFDLDQDGEINLDVSMPNEIVFTMADEKTHAGVYRHYDGWGMSIVSMFFGFAAILRTSIYLACILPLAYDFVNTF